MKSLIAKRYTNLWKNHFRVGFECEFILDTKTISLDNLEGELHEIHPDIYTDTDSSIKWNDDDYYNFDGIEIKTPPMTPYESLLVLHKVFRLINKSGFTNNSCGLHASFSPVSGEVYPKINPLKVLDNPLWAKMKKDFDRTDNTYCVQNPFNCNGKHLARQKIKDDPFKKWNNCIDYNCGIYDIDHLDLEIYTCADKYDGHSSDVNFDNYGKVQNSVSRIEIRCMGNKNYQRKFGLVSKYVQQIISTLKRGYGVKFD